LIVEMGIYRSFGVRGLLRIAESSAIAVSTIFVLLAMGALLSHFVVLADMPRIVLDIVRSFDMNWVAFLLFVNVLLFIAGMFIDPNSILLLFVPTLYPVATALGIDPVHFGLLVTLNV